MEKTRPKNSTIKPLSILSVPYMKIQEGTASLPLVAVAHAGAGDVALPLAIFFRQN